MKRLVLLLILLPALLNAAPQGSYNRAQLSQWLQEGAWEDIAALAKTTPQPDSFLLQSAGFAAYQAGDRAASADYYNRLLALDSSNRQALYYAGLMLKTDEQYTAAIPLLRRLCSLLPNVSQYHILLADCYSAKEERTAAVRHLRLAYTLAPSSTIIANKLSTAWMRLKRWDSATTVLNKAMKDHPRDPMLIGTGISLAYSKKDFARASSLTDSLIATGKLKYEHLRTGLYADLELKNYEHAIKIGEVLMALDGGTEEVLYYTAIAHQKLKDWEEADTLLRQCIAKVLKPNLEAYYTAEAEGAAELKDWPRAKACYDTAYYLFKNPLTLYSKGLMLQTAGRKKDAEQAFKKYLTLPESRQDTAIAHYMQRVIQE
jgi:tetratricopeptide (TPR) repeat protein